jgi:ankyrin repeat protein
MSWLTAAILAGSAEQCQAALKSGANPNEQDALGWTPLHHCGAQKALECARVLLAAGAKLELEDARGNQPLWTAVFEARGYYYLVDLYLQHGADPNHLNQSGRSPLMYANQLSDPLLFQKLARA